MKRSDYMYSKYSIRVYFPLYKNKYWIHRFLMTHVLGYTDEEIDFYFEKHHTMDYVATGLTLEQARQIAQPFLDYGQMALLVDESGDSMFWNDKTVAGPLPPQEPKDYYYDEPVVDRSHLCDVHAEQTFFGHLPPEFYQPSKETIEALQKAAAKPAKPVVECPYCHSTNTYKISGFEKVVNTGIFGIFGTKRHKQWSCKDCKSDF